MANSKEILAELESFISNKDQYVNSEGLTPKGRMQLSKSVASMGEIIQSDYGTYKLYEILDNISQAQSDNPEAALKSFKQLEYMLYSMKENEFSTSLHKIKEDRGENFGNLFAMNALRVARAEGIEFLDCEAEYNAVAPEMKIYEKQLNNKTQEMNNSRFNKERRQAEIDQIKERMEAEKRFSKSNEENLERE